MQRLTFSRGFSLLEVLVAFSIATVSFAIVFQIFSKATESVVLAEEYTVATLIAESKIDEMEVNIGLNHPPSRGIEYGNYKWALELSNYHSEQEFSNINRLELISVAVTVSWESFEKSHSVSLRTIKPLYEESY